MSDKKVLSQQERLYEALLTLENAFKKDGSGVQIGLQRLLNKSKVSTASRIGKFLVDANLVQYEEGNPKNKPVIFWNGPRLTQKVADEIFEKFQATEAARPKPLEAKKKPEKPKEKPSIKEAFPDSGTPIKPDLVTAYEMVLEDLEKQRAILDEALQSLTLTQALLKAKS
jgi:hypothetical protein